MYNFKSILLIINKPLETFQGFFSLYLSIQILTEKIEVFNFFQDCAWTQTYFFLLLLNHITTSASHF